MKTRFGEALRLQRAGRLDEAEAIYLAIWADSPSWKPEWVLGNLGAIYRETGRLADAERVLRIALAADPGNPSVRLTLGFALLQLGRYREGWAHYEARNELYPRPKSWLPEWGGESLAGKHIMVLPDQGLGDQILMCRMLPRLALEASQVTVVTPRSLARLFGHLPVQVVPVGVELRRKPDLWVSACSLPHWLGMDPSDAPQPPPLPKRPTKGAGLMLGGSTTNPNNAARLPGPHIARAIRGLGEFVELDPQMSGARDFLDTAHIMAGLERVVTIDTSVAHLAGTLGKPCYVLVPRPAIDWYTNWHDDRTPWYPSVRVIRQRSPGDWAGAIGEIASVLAQG